MLGFKLEAPQRNGSTAEQVRPIYLDMQVCLGLFACENISNVR